MRKLFTVALAGVAMMAFGFVTHAQIVPLSVMCLHGRPERAADRARREQAVAVLKALNNAEGQSLQQNRRFRPLSELPNLLSTPEGFRLRFYLNDAGYLASLKDERDPCYFGVFTDEAGFIYGAAPFEVPFVAAAK